MIAMVKRHKKLFFVGLVAFLLESFFKIRPDNLTDLMSAVLTLAATLTAIFIGFVSIILGFRNDGLFKSLNLDLNILEELMLGTIFYLLVSLISIISFFMHKGIEELCLLLVWFPCIAMAISATISLIKDLIDLLEGQRRRRNDKDEGF